MWWMWWLVTFAVILIVPFALGTLIRVRKMGDAVDDPEGYKKKYEALWNYLMMEWTFVALLVLLWLVLVFWHSP